MIYDEDAIKETAETFKVDDAFVKKCLSVAGIYESCRKRHKSLRHRARDEAQRIRQLEIDRVESPDECFCVRDGIEVVHDSEKDEVIGYSKAYGYGDWSHQHPYDKEIYKCVRCGKGWQIVVAWA
jgi:hypothetical protein